MTTDRFQALIEGAIAQWQIDARPRFSKERCHCVITRDTTTVSIEHLQTGLGMVWRIEIPGRTARVHRSVVPALATLRDTLCPERPRGRALFVQPPGGAA